MICTRYVSEKLAILNGFYQFRLIE